MWKATVTCSVSVFVKGYNIRFTNPIIVRKEITL